MIFWLVFAGFVQHLLHRLDLDPTAGEVSILWQKIGDLHLSHTIYSIMMPFPNKNQE